MTQTHAIKHVRLSDGDWKRVRRARPANGTGNKRSQRLPGLKLRDVSAVLGGISPRVLTLLAKKYAIPLQSSRGSIWIKPRDVAQLRSLREVQLIQKANADDTLGRDLTIAEMHEISQSRRRQPPWTINLQ